jgi:D-galactarolactone isomerase
MQRPVSGRVPRLKVPPGACDTHIHFYRGTYPRAPRGPAPPPDAWVPEYRQLQRWLGLERVVVVQPNAYGDDNRCTLDAVAALGSAARAVVVVRPEVSEAELQRLTEAGARAVRIMSLPGGALQLDMLHQVAARVRAVGWHPIVQLDGRTLPEHEASLRRIEGDYVIDHTGKFLVPVSPEHEAFKCLLRLVERGNCYVKLSAPYEVSVAGPPRYEDVGRLAKALVRAAPERMLWASNWPHPSAPADKYPNDADLLDLLLDWAPEEATRQRILVDNPARLYGF